MQKTYKPTILIDLDGVLNKYSGNYDKNIIPEMNENADIFLEKNIRLLMLNQVEEFDIDDKSAIGSLVGYLKLGTVEDCSVLGEVVVTAGNNGQGFSIGGLVGAIAVSGSLNQLNPIDADKVTDYLKGDCSVVLINSNRNKPWGLIVGSPNIGTPIVDDTPTTSPDNPDDPVIPEDPNGTQDDFSGSYLVNIYEMDASGEYSLKSSAESVGLVGNTVEARYSLSEGWTLDERKYTSSTTYTTSGVVKADNSLVLSVFIRNIYTITFKSDGTTVGTFTGIYGTTIEMPDVPEKPGYDIVGWIPDLPSKVPAKDLTVTALWGKIDPIFTIVIPSSLVMLEEDGCKGSMTLDVTVNQISSIGTLSISVRSGNNFHLFLKNHEAYNLPYEDYALQYFLYVGSSDNPVVQDGEIGRYTNSPTPPYHTSLKLNAEMPGEPKYAGDYEDLLTFTVKYTETI